MGLKPKPQKELLLRYNWVMAYLLDSPNGMTRKDLVEQTKIARTTLYDWLLKLKNWGYVGKRWEYRTTRGRPHTYWYLTPKGRAYVRGES